MRSGITRRLFLKGAALSAIGLPRIVPVTALGAGGGGEARRRGPVREARRRRVQRMRLVQRLSRSPGAR